MSLVCRLFGASSGLGGRSDVRSSMQLSTRLLIGVNKRLSLVIPRYITVYLSHCKAGNIENGGKG